MRMSKSFVPTLKEVPADATVASHQLLVRAGYEVVRMTRLGHSYRVRYVFDRLSYFHRRGAIGLALRTARLLSQPLGGLSLYLQLGDVVIASARRRD